MDAARRWPPVAGTTSARSSLERYPEGFAAAPVVVPGGGGFGGGGSFFGAPSGTSSVGAVSGVSTWTCLVSATLESGSTLGKSSGGLPSIAAFMNCSQMGSAAFEPVSFLPSETCLSSNPTQTPAVSEGVKPMNHASVKSLVVPV